MPNKEQKVDNENNVFDNESYQLNEIPISQHDVGGKKVLKTLLDGVEVI